MGRWGGCSAQHCSKRNALMYYRFPADPDLRLQWIISCEREPEWQPIDSDRLCSEHFENDQFEINADGRKVLIPNAIPTVFPVAVKARDAEQDISIPCCVKDCNDLTSLRFRFPPPTKYPVLFNKWLKTIKNPRLHESKSFSEIYRTYRVCQLHFAEECLDLRNTVRGLTSDAIPTKNLPISEDDANKIKEEVWPHISEVHNYSRLSKSVKFVSIEKQAEADIPQKVPQMVKKVPSKAESRFFDNFKLLPGTEKKFEQYHLIYLVGQYRHLYDQEHKFYHNGALKIQSWDEIAAAIGLTSEECHTAWRNLKHQYLRIARFGDEASKQWEYFVAIDEIEKSKMLRKQLNETNSIPEKKRKHVTEQISFLVNGERVTIFPEEENDDIGEIENFTVIKKVTSWRQLLGLIKMNRNLFAHAHKDYNNQQMTKDTWINISESIGINVVECKALWEYFKAKYQRVLQMPKTATDWDFYDDMSFFSKYLFPNLAFKKSKVHEEITSKASVTSKKVVVGTSQAGATTSNKLVLGDYITNRLKEMDPEAQKKKRIKLLQVLEESI